MSNTLINDEANTDKSNTEGSIRGGFTISLDRQSRLGMQQEILLSNGDSIIIATGLNSGAGLTAKDLNQNLFRINKIGEIIWQVQRDEQGKYFPQGKDQDSFAALYLEDISSKKSQNTRFISDRFIEGHKLIGLTKHYPYVIDINTGLALNIFEGGRPW